MPLVVPAAAINAADVLPALPTRWPNCGTDAGWWRHQRATEQPCRPCTYAHHDADADRKRRRSRVWPIREWCWATGRPVGGAGPIPRLYVEAYRAAHPEAAA